MENGFSIGGGRFFDRKTGSEFAVKPAVQNGKASVRDGGGSVKSIYAGDLQQEGDEVSEKFALAQKLAVHKLLAQFEDDYKLDLEMEERSAHADALKEKIAEDNHGIRELDERRESLKKELGIDPDSAEQKDLELMQKANDAKKHPFEEAYQLSDEEKERYKNLPPVTPYQEAMLLYDAEEDERRKGIDRNQKEIRVDNATNEATKLALLKVHPMVDAMKEADAMMDQALKDMVSSLLEKGTEKVDEEKEERQEKIAEEREEALEEKLEREKHKAEDEKKREELRSEVENAVLSTVLESVNYSGQAAMANLQAGVKSLIQDQVVLDVDLKGLKVDLKIAEDVM